MTDFIQHSALRYLIIGGVMLAMSLPLALVSKVTQERQQYADVAAEDVAASWGGAQRVFGPMLIVPEVQRVEQRNSRGYEVWHEQQTERVYLPKRLNLAVELPHQLRGRGAYDVPVYQAELRLRGDFAAVVAQQDDTVTQLWDQARLVVGISHTRAINSLSPLVFGEKQLPFKAGTLVADQPGVHVPLGLDAQDGFDFDVTMVLRGSQALRLIPVADDSKLQAGSTWPHPSFAGRYLPDQRTISDAGFRADWQVHELARDLPSQFTLLEHDLRQVGAAEMVLYQPITSYRFVDRGIKYGLLFIAMTFLVFVCFELVGISRLHIVQYAVVGLALVLFYMATLALSEHIHFGWAYAIASLVLVGLTGGYVWRATGHRRVTLSLVVTLVSLYALLFVLLSLETFALLAGTTVLFFSLIALMWATHRLRAA